MCVHAVQVFMCGEKAQRIECICMCSHRCFFFLTEMQQRLLYVSLYLYARLYITCVLVCVCFTSSTELNGYSVRPLCWLIFSTHTHKHTDTNTKTHTHTHTQTFSISTRLHSALVSKCRSHSDPWDLQGSCTAPDDVVFFVYLCVYCGSVSVV